MHHPERLRATGFRVIVRISDRPTTINCLFLLISSDFFCQHADRSCFRCEAFYWPGKLIFLQESEVDADYGLVPFALVFARFLAFDLFSSFFICLVHLTSIIISSVGRFLTSVALRPPEPSSPTPQLRLCSMGSYPLPRSRLSFTFFHLFHAIETNNADLSDCREPAR